MLNFLASKAEKENRINKLIDEALINSIAVYLYNTFQLNDENWQTTLQAQQRQIIQNVFYKRLSSQLDEKVALSVVRETNNAKLRNYFNGPDFQFFDAHGTLWAIIL